MFIKKRSLATQESGDTYFIHSEKDYSILAIADGLGSGPIARQSAEIIPVVLKNIMANRLMNF